MVTNGDIRIRVSEAQKQQLRNLSEAEGHRTLSDYVRSKIFNNLATDTKINEILTLLKNAKAGGKLNE